MPRATRPKLAQPPLLRKFMDRALTEKQWQKQVEGALKDLGWWFNHNPPNVIICKRCGERNYRGIERGIPDLWIIKPPFMGWLELKRERGWVDPDQRGVQRLIQSCSILLPPVNARPRDREYLYDLIAHPQRND